MNNIQIDCFLATAELKNYTRAAQRVHLSQPTVSRYVAALEKELGCELLMRTTKRVELTPAGEVYHRLFSQWNLQLENARAEVWALLAAQATRLQVGYMDGWIMQRAFSECCARFRAEHPDIRLGVTYLSREEIVSGLQDGSLDLGLVLENPIISSCGLSVKPVLELRKIIICAPWHPLASKPDLSPEDFRDETFFVTEDNEDYAARKNVEYCRAYHFVPKIAHEKNIQTVYGMIQGGAGVAIVDEWSLEASVGMYRAVPIEAKGYAYLVWRPETLRPAAADFVEGMQI